MAGLGGLANIPEFFLDSQPQFLETSTMTNRPSDRIENAVLANVSDVVYVPVAESDLPAAESAGEAQLESTLRISFEAEPLEDGMNHPAEEIIGAALQSSTEPCLLGWLRAFSLDVTQPSFAACVLRCLGRLAEPGTSRWRAELVRAALAIEELEIRDAVVQAVESWKDPELIDLLESHSEPVTWLQDYARDVFDDLSQ